MQKMFKGLLVLALLAYAGIATAGCDPCEKDTCCNCQDLCGGGNPYFSIRSQSINAARDLVGWQTHINKFEMNSFYGALYVTPEYTRSFKSCHIAGYLFGQDYSGGSLSISGSRKGVTPTAAEITAGTKYAVATDATKRENSEWLADYFGLPVNFESTVQFTPKISNFLVDFGAYIGFDETWQGGFFRIHAPLVHTKWELNPCENVINKGTLGFQAGYMSSTVVDAGALKERWVDTMTGGHTWGDMKEALTYGKISTNAIKRTRLSDIEMAIGCNISQGEDYHFGVMLRTSAPTGLKPEATYLFEPMIGSGGHWMVGAGCTAHSVMWSSDDEEKSLALYMDVNAGHYFNAKQVRSFDLKGKPNSRYALIQELGTPVENLYANDLNATSTTIPSAIYQGNLFPLINKSTCCADVSIAVQGDLAIKLAFTKGDWVLDLGYNLWARSGEKFKDDCCTGCCFDSDKKWALKGDAFIYGFGASNATELVDRDKAFPLSATQSKADINGGTNTPTRTKFSDGTTDTSQVRNPNIDNRLHAWHKKAGLDKLMYAPGIAAVTKYGGQSTSKDPKFLTCDDLNTCDTASAVSHKIFFNLNYNCSSENFDEDDWTPFLGLGGEVEFSAKSDGVYNSLSQWGIWLKGGIAFQ